MRRPAVIVGLALAALIAAGVLRQRVEYDVPVVLGTERPAAPPSATALALRRERSHPVDMRAASLRGTHIDGRVRVDADGRLVVDVALRRYLDYFLSAQGECDLFALRAGALRASGLGPRGQTQLAAFFDRYLGYLRDLPPVPPGNPEQALHGRRVRHFGSRDATALFADQAVTAEAIARRKTHPDAEPEPALHDSEAWRHLLVSQTRWNGMPEVQRQDERRALYGGQAAERLQRVDQRRRAWDEGVAGLRWQLAGLDGPARRHALQRMLDAAVPAYSPAQRRRIHALLVSP